MKVCSALVLALVCATAVSGQAAPVEAIVRDALATQLPAGLGIVAVHVPVGLRQLDLDPSTVSVVVPRELRAGRPSLKVAVPGKRAVWVPVSLAPAVTVAVLRRAVAAGSAISEDDVGFEERATSPGAAPEIVVGARATRALVAGNIVGPDDVVMPSPLSRGTRVTIEIRRGAVRVKGTGTLERAARPGEATSARLAATKQVIHGTLVAPSTLLVTGDVP